MTPRPPAPSHPAPSGWRLHVLAFAIYLVIIYLAALAYCVMAEVEPLLVVLLAVPLFLSGAIAAITLLGVLLAALRWLWRNRGTWRS